MSGRLDGRRSGTRRDRGQGSLEMVALVPIVLTLMLAALQVIVLTYTAHAASQAAREGARAYSLGESPTAAVDSSLPGGIERVDVRTGGPDHTVSVTVEAPPVLVVAERRITRKVTMP